jgi:hypothetical protein
MRFNPYYCLLVPQKSLHAGSDPESSLALTVGFLLCYQIIMGYLGRIFGARRFAFGVPSAVLIPATQRVTYLRTNFLTH